MRKKKNKKKKIANEKCTNSLDCCHCIVFLLCFAVSDEHFSRADTIVLRSTCRFLSIFVSFSKIDRKLAQKAFSKASLSLFLCLAHTHLRFAPVFPHFIFSSCQIYCPSVCWFMRVVWLQLYLFFCRASNVHRKKAISATTKLAKSLFFSAVPLQTGPRPYSLECLS